MKLILMLYRIGPGDWLDTKLWKLLQLFALELSLMRQTLIHKSGGRELALANTVLFHLRWNGVKACYQNPPGISLLRQIILELWLAAKL